jgi:hypothetical protein
MIIFFFKIKNKTFFADKVQYKMLKYINDLTINLTINVLDVINVYYQNVYYQLITLYFKYRS